MPMVWYIPPLSPVVDAVSPRRRHDGRTRQPLRGAGGAAHPDQYLAGLFTAGDTAVVEGVLRRLAAMRSLHARHQSGPRNTAPFRRRSG